LRPCGRASAAPPSHHRRPRSSGSPPCVADRAE
jgi:hypothetical protein